MNFLLGTTTSTLQSFLEKKTVIKADMTVCTPCGKKMQEDFTDGVRKYVCNFCGFYNKTNEIVEIKEPEELEKASVIYGSKSGTGYLRKIKEDLKAILQVAQNQYPFTDEQVADITKTYLAIRADRIPRATPRIGLICACIHKITQIPIDYLSKFFKIDQSYITEGEKIYRRELIPFENISVYELIQIEFNRFTHHKALMEVQHVKPIINEMVKLCLAFQVATDTTVKTKISGLMWYLIDVQFLKFDQQRILTILDIGKNTVYKFYDQFILSLYIAGRQDKKYTENLSNRRKQLREYLQYRKIPLIDLPKKNRLNKFSAGFTF